MRTIMKKLLLLLGVALTGWLCFWITPKGFEYLTEMRQLERVPPIRLAGAVAGEINTTALARAGTTLLSSHLTRTPSIYYRYRHEVEETDSDGNTHWNTKEDFAQASDFVLEDDTGTLVVRVAEDRQRPIDWIMNHAYQKTEGRHRYTEWRLEPGEQVFVFARVSDRQGRLEAEFRTPGQYTPIISKESAFAARSGMGARAVWLIWLGLFCFSLSVFAALWLAQVHRVLVFCSLLSLGLAVVLVHFGLDMMRHDLHAASARYEQQREASEAAMRKDLARANLPWESWQALGDFYGQAYDGLAVGTRLRLREIRLNLEVARQRVMEQRNRVPERWLLRIWSLPAPEAVAGIAQADRSELERRAADFVPSRVDGLWPSLVAGIASVLVALFCWLGLRLIALKRYIENVPTSLTQGLVFGMAELQGKVTLLEPAPLKGPLTNRDCIWFRYQVEERRGSGKNARWVTIDSRHEEQAFYCEDREGRLKIVPTDAEIITRHTTTRREGRLRYHEACLCPGDALYALGFAAVDDAQGTLFLHKEAQDPFILSNYSEAELLLRKGRAGLILLDLAFAFTLLAGLMLLSAGGGLAPTDFLFAALLAPLLLTLLMLVIHYNDLVFLRQRTERARANIGVSRRKRFDLVPNLVAALQGYLDHEQALQTRLTQWRTLARQADTHAPDPNMQQAEQAALSGIRLVSEAYPDLKADQQVQRLMRQLSQLETEVALMQAGFLDAVTGYNTRLASFPDLLLAKLFGFKPVNDPRLAGDEALTK